MRTARFTAPSATITEVTAKNILEKTIADGIASARSLFDKLESDRPQDAIVTSRALSFGYDPVIPSSGVGSRMALTVRAREGIIGSHTSLNVHAYAQRQLAERAGIPTAYLDQLLNGEGASTWSRDLATHALNEHFTKGNPTRRNLLRSVHGELRGFLSDKYRRLDSRPLAKAVADSCHEVGAIPYRGTFSDTRVALKVILPGVYEPIPGEFLAIGGEWSNSDYGAGTNSFRWFLLRCWCLNGATGESVVKEVHLGGRLPDDMAFSNRTYELDTRTSVSAMRDMVKSTLSKDKVTRILDSVKDCATREVDWKHVPGNVLKALTKAEAKFAQDAFEGQDVMNLPEGKSLWRASNAISWLANHTEGDDRRLELERLAGSLVKAA
jgi:hypothetical protein